jgi:hypothetical protein
MFSRTANLERKKRCLKYYHEKGNDVCLKFIGFFSPYAFRTNPVNDIAAKEKTVVKEETEYD